ncbi:MAG: hypothetical protein HY815_33455 [Candidatus Riflebacteria bacterium]|nr:hypothetical protein [Candidatus Riflebacteria bacterium]
MARRPGHDLQSAGVGTLAVVVSLLAVAGIVVATWASTSGQALVAARRIRQELRALEAARSALAEAHFNLQRAVNDPAETLFTVFRRPGGPGVDEVLPLPPLIHTHDLPGAGQISIQVAARVSECRAHPVLPRTSEGTVCIEARATTAAGQWRGVGATWGFRVQHVTLPAPMDRWVIGPGAGSELQVFGATPGTEGFVDDPQGQLRSTPQGAELYQALASPLMWRSGLAAFQVGVGSNPAGLQKWLEDRLAGDDPEGVSRRVNGIVVVEGHSGVTQRVAGVRFRGRALVVLTCKVSLEAVTVENPTEDLLSVICYDAATLAGKLDLSLLRLLPPEAVGTSIDLSSGTVDLCGSLIDATGVDVQEFKGTLTANPRASSRRRDTPEPSHAVVLISPLRRAGGVTRG